MLTLTPSFSVLAFSFAAVSAQALTSKSITWIQCPDLNKNISNLLVSYGPFTSFECGTLQVPLDYTIKDSPELKLDLFRLKAKREPALGTILFNPGGPGGDGPTNLGPKGTDLREVIGEEYNIVTWDPRGTGNTIPFNCTLPTDGASTSSRKRDIGSPSLPTTNLTAAFLEFGWDTAELYAETCTASNNITGRLIGTPFVARDMLEIVDSLGEDGMLRYYGISYGTVLGHYFATMFPERVERMVLDGTLDPNDYRTGTYGDTVADSDAVFHGFLEACIDNKDSCALATALGANSTEGLFNAIALAIGPLAKNATTIQGFSALTATKSAIFAGLYFPSLWPTLAETLVEALNATSPSPSTQSSSPPNVPWWYGKAANANYGIRASDATFKPKSAEEYLPQVEFQANVSDFADSWYFGFWPSARWMLPAKERFFGNFTAKTKHPILYVNGEFDPVCPLRDAVRASKRYEGSVVLVHTGFGHTVLANPSSCVHNYTKAYFKEGVLPVNGTVCKADLDPWALAKARNGKRFGALNATEP
jgi:pimeloyl-ACP methyl ester carboxylesterase